MITLSDNVHSWLILMHGVQNNLFKETHKTLQHVRVMTYIFRKVEKSTKSLRQNRHLYANLTATSLGMGKKGNERNYAPY